jgi:Zn finger protein HypA/HybF involved in hydrogenase expression
MTEKKMTPCCPSCESSNLDLDASAEWNQEKQEFEFELITVYCNFCHNIGDYKLIPNPA